MSGFEFFSILISIILVQRITQTVVDLTAIAQGWRDQNLLPLQQIADCICVYTAPGWSIVPNKMSAGPDENFLLIF